MATLVDTNVLIDVAVKDATWHGWSRKRLAERHRAGPLFINQIVFSEFSYRYETMEEVEVALPADVFIRRQLPWRAAYAAARAFRRYREDGGSRERILPDFMIGAHAVIAGIAILSRDTSLYRRYFPTVSLIAPDTHP